MDIRKELFLPNYRRVKKLIQLSVGIEISVIIILSAASYLSLGNKHLPELLFLGKIVSTNNYDFFLQGTLNFGFFIVSILGLPIFNVPIKRLLYQILRVKQVTIKQYVLISVLPMTIVFAICIVYPFII